jgi:hypothetical protein
VLAFFSRRLRQWVLFALAVPIVRKLVQALARARERNHPGARTTRALRRTDSALARLGARRKKK